MYVNAPNQSTILNPKAIANIIVRIGARTEKHPFIAHAHDTRDLFFSERILSPVGKGMPIRRPRGRRGKNTRTILTLITKEEMTSIMEGRIML